MDKLVLSFSEMLDCKWECPEAAQGKTGSPHLILFYSSLGGGDVILSTAQ